VRVLTPEVRELADYRVDPGSIDTIGQAARLLRKDVLPNRAVGVMGMSFSGGLALLAAAAPTFREAIDFVVAVGAHDDLERVSRFFATNAIARPDGTELAMQAHDYGPLVLVYSHIEDFFPAEDVDVARDALRAWLWDRQDEARLKLVALSEPSRAMMGRLFDHRIDSIAPALLREIDKTRAAMALVSPHGHLGSVRAAVYLLHGAGDTVIPPSETQWLARDLPPGVLRRVLISPAIGHVELGGDPSMVDEWGVIDFLAAVLSEIDAPRAHDPP
jgi:pimeloyl-ACP methyl ester carboxylesterase